MGDDKQPSVPVVPDEQWRAALDGAVDLAGHIPAAALETSTDDIGWRR